MVNTAVLAQFPGPGRELRPRRKQAISPATVGRIVTRRIGSWTLHTGIFSLLRDKCEFVPLRFGRERAGKRSGLRPDLEFGHFQAAAPNRWGMLQLARRARLAQSGLRSDAQGGALCHLLPA